MIDRHLVFDTFNACIVVYWFLLLTLTKNIDHPNKLGSSQSLEGAIVLCMDTSRLVLAYCVLPHIMKIWFSLMGVQNFSGSII